MQPVELVAAVEVLKAHVLEPVASRAAESRRVTCRRFAKFSVNRHDDEALRERLAQILKRARNTRGRLRRRLPLGSGRDCLLLD